MLYGPVEDAPLLKLCQKLRYVSSRMINVLLSSAFSMQIKYFRL